VLSLSGKSIRINTCGQFPEVLILRDLWSDKTRQNTVKRGVGTNAENKGVAEFELAENKKRQLEAGGTKWKANCYLRDIISQCDFLSRKKRIKQHSQTSRSSFPCRSYRPIAIR
jgi:hypothetical protein